MYISLFDEMLKYSMASTKLTSESLGHIIMINTSIYIDSFEDETKKEMMKALKNF
jgi:hypothetical protein